MRLRVVPELYDQLPTNPVDMLLVSFPSQEDIAGYCAVSKQAVANWKSRWSIPYIYIDDLSRATGIPQWMLCPKHFEKGEMDAVVYSVGEGRGEDGEVSGSDAGEAVRVPGLL